MAQTFTLEEAAQRLALSSEEFKRRLKEEWKHIRSFRDGATLRFRAADIDELARMMGEMSDPGLQLAPVGTDTPTEPDGSDDFLLPPETPSDSSPGISLGGQDHPLLLSNDPEFVLPTGDGTSRRIPKPSAIPEQPSDSDVRIDAMPAGYQSSDPDFSMPTEDITLDLSGPSSAVIKPSASSTKLPSPRPGNKLTGPPSATRIGGSPKSKISGPPSGKIPSPKAGTAADASSEFDLNLDADGDSFELNLANDSSEEVALGGLDLGPPKSSAHGMRSGINLGKPADSGLALDAKKISGGPKSGMMPKGGKGTTPSDSSDIDFELTMDGPSNTGRSGPKSAKMKMDSDSEFELSLDDDLNAGDSDLDAPPKTGILDQSEAKDDIFETDFELPAISDDSGSEVVAVDELIGEDEGTSDFDLAISEDDAITDEESASQVVLVDDDEPMVAEDDSVDVGAALSEVETDDSPSASAAMRGVRGARDVDEDEDDYTGRPMPAAPTKWGALPAMVLLPSLLLTFLGGLMSFELLRGMWGYHQPSPPQNMLVRGVAGALDMKISD